MAETKDKVVTVESLSALHEHNKEAYMVKNSPIGAGSLSINRKADTVVGDCSTTIGYNNESSAWCSYAEGENNISSGNYSHASGYNTIVTGDYAYAEGVGTITSSDYQHVQGKYNIADENNKYAHIVGNGIYDDEADTITRSNAHTIDWDGNAWFSGGGSFGGSIYANGNATFNGYGLFDGDLLVNGNIILSSNQYGDTLPAAGTEGRIFFKKVSE